MTEAAEFQEIYEPGRGGGAHKQARDPPGPATTPCTKRKRGKFNAVIEQIIECHEKGQPVLVGTISIEKASC